MYLSKMKRDITEMFYYENKSGDEVSKSLGIPASTVRWHLSQVKIDLKEKIEMTEQNGIY
ncbi:RNA polymerase sigma factor [compost metagenome]